MAIIKIYEFAEIHKEVIRNYKKYKLNFLQGAVRSGKSHLTNHLFLNEIEDKEGSIVLSGYSSTTVKKNVVDDLQKILGVEFKFRNNSSGEYFEIPMKKYSKLKFYTVGGAREGDEKKVQGMTVLVWYADEAASYAESFFNMMLTRLSREDSRAFFTLNPEGPSHYIKKFIDKHENKTLSTYIEGYVKSYRFKLDDNNSLPLSYKQQQHNSYSGHMYKRLILGEWAVGEGLVYSVDKLKYISLNDFKEIYNNAENNRMYDRYNPKYDEKHNIGVDLGTVHPTAFVKCWKYKGVWYIVSEFYKPKISPSELAVELDKFNKDTRQDEFTDNDIFYDHAAKWFFQQMNQDYKSLKLIPAKKEVLKGIMYVENLILNGRLVIVKDNCPNLINEFNSYSWDSKSNNDDVIKLNDDALDALRYAIYSTEYQTGFY